MKKSLIVLSITCIAFILTGFISKLAQEPWPVPDKYVKMANPVKADAASIAEGKELYVKHCQSCHGKKGKGDGTKAAQLDTDCGDFTTAAFAKQTDGAVFYKTLEGRKDMPSYKKKIPDQNEVWSVVNYVRTLK